jgi:hypothetical protein
VYINSDFYSAVAEIPIRVDDNTETISMGTSFKSLILMHCDSSELKNTQRDHRDTMKECGEYLTLIKR